ncbi:ExeM/NucH family extracellular endonuclease [Ornithinimicrobium humiphilum]|uniref:LTD domain-containing protein n=1 Tax=Ornithinimicrobium humiphilum TaxID=125288 RepID=A0A543KMF1_9MICO|nr:ExeM/NucH family extracellular endonuclease [Ornithinimicrobium humiphilum]TQM96259.1 hypothetical protein FB476_1123 [Ornithinimicrobium humiphilum]
MNPSLRPKAAVAAVGATTLLATLLVPTATAYADDDPTTLDDLIFSEYVEGSSNNKALEIYNGTSAPVDLGGYAIQQYSNGSASAGFTASLAGTLAPGDVYVFAHSSADAAILAQADQTTGTGLFNGNDALTLVKDGGTVVDSIGQVGFDPGTEWGTGLTSTADNTLRRKADVCEGDTVKDDAFDPAVQWDGFPNNTFDGLGTHTTTCGAGEPDPEPEPEPEPEPGSCFEDAMAIGAVQGSGAATPVAGQVVTVEGVVVGDYQHSGSFNGIFVQDAGDGDPATSDGIYVFLPSGPDVSVGDRVRVTGTASEFSGQTQLSNNTVQLCATDQALPPATTVSLPLGDPEPLESMLVTFPQDLAILEYFEYARYGEVVLGVGDGTLRQYQPTAVHDPGSAGAAALLAFNAANRIRLDDGLNIQNPDYLRHPAGGQFTLDHGFRGGDTLANLTGVLDYRFNQWRVQPTQDADFTVRNARPDVPEVGGTTTVASFNVLNYFTTLGSRGADDQAEFDRQESKIVSAINAMDAEIVGLIEIENNGDVAVGRLVTALNQAAGETRWAFVSTGRVGTDEITTAFIYQPAKVTPVGPWSVLDSSVDARFDDTRNRPALAQTFQENGTDGKVTVVVNHLKSKGSACPGDPDTGQGNCNEVRAAAADALGDWANDDPTGTGVDEVLIIGDLNSYDHEDPIRELREDGFVDLLKVFGGEYAYTYVFDGVLGYLDYAMASDALAPKVTGAAAWQINADEAPVLDYELNFKGPGQAALFAPDPYRSSDHDPVLVGLDLVAPELEVVASPSSVWPPNNKWVDVETVILASDDSGEQPTVALIGAEVVSAGPNGKGAIEVVSDSHLRVVAATQAVYEVTYEATDAAGNSTTATVTITVGKP